MSAVHAPAGALRWPAGKRLVMTVAWSASTEGALAPGGGGKGTTRMAVDTNVEADVALEGLGPRGEGTAVAISYAAIRQFTFRMQGQDVEIDGAQLAKELQGKEAVVTLDGRARILDVAFDEALSPSLRVALRALVQQLQYTLPEGGEAEWAARETNTVGTARTRYVRDGDRFNRTHTTYEQVEALAAAPAQQTVRSEAVVTVDGDGLPASILETEAFAGGLGDGKELVQARWSFSASRTASTLAPRRAPPALTAAQPLDARIKDPDLARRRDERLAAKITAEQLELEPGRFQQGIKHPADFLPRAGAWLRLHPQAAHGLAKLFEQPELDVKGRGFILDMLATAGDANAQAAMREALRTKAAREQPKEFLRLVQRFTFVTEPAPESAAFLSQSYRAAIEAHEVPAAQGAVVALGATLDRLQKTGQDSVAREYAANLRDDLSRSESPEVQRALLSALGNAKRPENVASIAAYAGSKDPLVRAQVASALRSVESADARAALVGLAGDYNSDVALRALAALRLQKLEERDFRALRALAETQKLNTSADPELLRLVREQAAGGERTAILTALLSRNQGGENDLGAIIEELLRGG